MSQFAPEDSQGNIDLVSNGDVILESDRNQDGVGDLVFRTAGVERARIKHDGSGTGWSNVLGGSITDLFGKVDNQNTVSEATANTAIIQAALDAGQIPLLPPGKIWFNQIVIPSLGAMRGCGVEQTFLYQADGNAVDAIVNHAHGDTFLDLRDFAVRLDANTNALGGIILTGAAYSKLIGVQVQASTTDAFAVIGGGTAVSGDAMKNEFLLCQALNIVSGRHLRVAPAAGGGSHPDGTRWYGGLMQSNVGVGFQIDPASADTSGYLAADSCIFCGCLLEGVPTPFLLNGQTHKIRDLRCEVTSGTMTLQINDPNPTNNKTTGNLVAGCSFETYGDATKLLIVNNGGNRAVAFRDCWMAGGWL